MFIISPSIRLESMSGHIGAIYGWSPEQVALMFTTFIIFQSVGMLPRHVARQIRAAMDDRHRRIVSGSAILSIALGPSYPVVLVLWSVGSFFTDSSKTTPSLRETVVRHKRGVMTGLIGAPSPGVRCLSYSDTGYRLRRRPKPSFTVVYIMAASSPACRSSSHC